MCRSSSPRGALFVATPGQAALLGRTLRAAGRHVAAVAPAESRRDAGPGAGAAPRASARWRARARCLRHRRARAAPGLPARPAPPRRRSWRATPRSRASSATAADGACSCRRARIPRAACWSTPPVPGPTRWPRLAGVAPVGLQPKRRSAFTFAPPAGLDATRWPGVVARRRELVLQARRRACCWARRPMPTRSPPHDVQPEELDIAIGDRPHRDAPRTLKIRRPIRTWAGLRSFVADGDLVGGFDPHGAGLLLGGRAGRLRHPDLGRDGPGLRRAAARRSRCRSSWPTSGSRPRCCRRRGRETPEPRHPMRVFTATLATETNTFAPMPTGLASFQERGYYAAGQHPDAHELLRRPAVGSAAARARPLGWTLVRGHGRRGAARRHHHARGLRDAARRAAGRPARRAAGRRGAARAARRDGRRGLRRLRRRPARSACARSSARRSWWAPSSTRTTT